MKIGKIRVAVGLWLLVGLTFFALVLCRRAAQDSLHQQLDAVQHALGMRQLTAEPVGRSLWRVVVEGQTRLVDVSGKQPVVYGRVAVSAAWAETLPMQPDTKLVAVDAKRLLPRLPAPRGN